MWPKPEAGHIAEEGEWSIAQAVAVETGIGSYSWEVEAEFLEAVSEVVAIPAATPLVCQRRFLGAASQDEDLEEEAVGSKMPLVGAVGAEVGAGILDVVGWTVEVEDPECRFAVDCP
jgi:hypothetical protein